jgi:hypothetical protein
MGTTAREVRFLTEKPYLRRPVAHADGGTFCCMRTFFRRLRS